MISSVTDQANDDEQRQKNPLHDVTAIPTASILERRTICQENLRQIHKSMRLTRCDGGLNMPMEPQPVRSEYKKVWSALSTTEDQAKLHVIGVTEEVAL